MGLGWDLVITRPNLSNLFHMLSVGSLNIHESRSISSFIIRVRPSSQQSKNSKMFQTSKHLPKKKNPLRLQSHLVAAAETPPLFLDRRRPPSGGAHVRPDVLQPLLQLVVRLTNGGLLFSSCQWIFKKKREEFFIDSNSSSCHCHGFASYRRAHRQFVVRRFG